RDEWGTVWHTVDDTMGHVRHPAITDITRAGEYVLPDPHLPARWAQFDEQIRQHADRYVVGNAQYLCYDRLAFLLGTAETLEALLLHPAEVQELMDRIVAFELEIVDELAQRGVHGIRFWDDVGGSTGTVMGPATWRAMFKERYARAFAHIRGKGLHVHWHSCGNCLDIMEDLVEVGAEVFSIGEPFMMGVAELAGRFGQRVCFECSPDNRLILSRANRDEINAAVDDLVWRLSSAAGGLILIAAPDNFDCVPTEAQEMAMAAVRRAAGVAPG
ncbi:MAG: uroporphyrinogen decarboxylase family protein, partial [Phycisphaeraceae bacterium]|nr:uroporphyrinogen decarboxylase family protein [Phycisphaeraceae bacterium]